MACLPELEEKGWDSAVFTSAVDLMKEYTTKVILEVTEPGPCLALSTDYCEQDYLKRQRGGEPYNFLFFIWWERLFRRMGLDLVPQIWLILLKVNILFGSIVLLLSLIKRFPNYVACFLKSLGRLWQWVASNSRYLYINWYYAKTLSAKLQQWREIKTASKSLPLGGLSPLEVCNPMLGVLTTHHTGSTCSANSNIPNPSRKTQEASIFIPTAGSPARSHFAFPIDSPFIFVTLASKCQDEHAVVASPRVPTVLWQGPRSAPGKLSSELII